MDNPNVVYPYNGILFSHKKELSTVTRMNLEIIKLRERSQAQKKPPIIGFLCEISKIGKSIETENRWVVARGWGERKEE